MKLSQKYLELFLTEMKSYRRLTVDDMNYYAQNPEALLEDLREQREKRRLEKEASLLKKSTEDDARRTQLIDQIEELEKNERKSKDEEDAHILEVTSMDLPLDFENMYTLDERTSEAHTESVSDGLILSLSNLGRVDIEYISAITGKDLKEVIMALKGSIYQNPETWDECFYKGWEDADTYLSGALFSKWKIASEANEKYKGYFSDNVSALERVMPSHIASKDIYVTLGSPWLPADIVDDFVEYLIGKIKTHSPDTFKTRHDDESGTWEIPNKSRYTYTAYRNICESTYGAQGNNALHIIEKTLNQAPMAVYDEVYGHNLSTKPKRVFNERASMLLAEKQRLILEKFKGWVWKDPKRRQRLEQIYEERYGSTRVRHFDGSFLTFPNLNPNISLYPYQRNAIARILFTPNTLLAHDVGSGKTFIMICAGMELKRMGISKKNLYVVPNNLVGQWRDIFLDLYPSAKLLTVEPKSFTPKKRFETLRKMRDEEYDGIIIAYSSFELIPLSKKQKISLLEAELEKYNKATANLYSDRFSRQKKSLASKISKLEQEIEITLGKIFFDELNINTIFLDEAHNYKNVPLNSRVERMHGISTAGSARCQDMLDKISIVQARNNGRGAVFATGTPITNSITDAFTMQRYLQYGELKMLGLGTFDSWIGMFAEKHTDFEIDIDTSTYRLTTRFSRFHNLPELTSLFASIADFHIVDKSIGVPDFKGYTDTICTPTNDFTKYLKLISKRADLVRSGKVKRKDDNLLLITTDGKKAALDMRLIDPSTPCKYDSKVAQCARNVFKLYRDYDDIGATQLVFCDSSTPKDEFNLYDELKDMLIRLGVASDDIAFIHSATTPKLREQMFKRVREGEIRVLIGSTFKLGLGVNVQDKLIAIHHLDVPWRPADMTQREGRILRQGNTNPEIFIYRYVTTGSFDAYSWQLLETKQRFITSILSGHLRERSGSDISDTALSYAEVKAIAVGNPLVKKRVETSNELDRLTILRRERFKQLEAMEQELESLPSKIENQAKLVTLTAKDKDFVLSCVDFPSKDERKSVRDALEIAIRDNVLSTDESVLLEYRGFEIVLPAGMSEDKPFVWLRRDGKYYVELGESSGGYLTRIDNFIDKIDKHLGKLQDALSQLCIRKSYIEDCLKERDVYKDKIEGLQRALAKIDKELGVSAS